MRSPQTFLPFLLLLLLPSCLISRDTINEPLDKLDTSRLVVGETSAAAVAQILGAPNEVVQLGRRSAWRYDFARSKRSGLFLFVVNFQNVDTRQDRIWVFFDEQNVLSHWGTTFEADNARYAMPWQDGYDEAEESGAPGPPEHDAMHADEERPEPEPGS